MGNFKEDLASVRAFVFDVDGVFTDGGIIIGNNDEFIRKYNAKDGYAVAYALKMGYPVAIITGGRGATIETRFTLLGVTRLYINCADKVSRLCEFMEEFGLEPHEVMFMGDDIPDRAAMAMTGMPVCPSDAVAEVVEVSRYVSPYAGGKGCVRDVIEQVLRARGDWARDSMGVNTVVSA